MRRKGKKEMSGGGSFPPQSKDQDHLGCAIGARREEEKKKRGEALLLASS